MAITRYAGDRFAGLSGDTKPTNVVDGAVFNELDTGRIYHFFDGWVEIEYAADNLNIFRDISNEAGIVQFSADGHTDEIRFADSGATTVSFDAGTNTITIASTDTDTTYTAGDGLDLTGTVFSADYASTLEATTGTNNIKLMTPLRVAEAIDDRNYLDSVASDSTLTGDGTSGSPLSVDIDVGELGDVVITTPQNEHILSYDSGSGTWINTSIGDITPAVAALNDLSDVTIDTVATGHFLRYNGTQWVNLVLDASHVESGTFADARIAESNVTQHEDALTINTTQLTTSGVNTGQFLVYDGANWTNTTVGVDHLSDVSITGGTLTSGQFLIYDGAEWVNDDLPSLAITEVYVVADIAARDLLTVQEGDVAVVTDASDDPDVRSGSASYIYDGNDWQKIRGPDVTAAGNDTWIQYNDADDFGAATTFRFNDATARTTLEGQMTFTENDSITVTNPGHDSATMFVQTRVDGADTITEFMARTEGGDVVIASYVQP